MTERVAIARRFPFGLIAAGMALLLLIRAMPAAVARDPLPTAGTGRLDAFLVEEAGRGAVAFEVGPAVRDGASALVHAGAGSDATEGVRFRTALPDGRLSLAGVGGGRFGPAPKLGDRRDVAFDLDARLLAGRFGEVTATGGYRNRYRAKTRRLGDTETEFGGSNDLSGLGLRLDLLGGRLRGTSEMAWSQWIAADEPDEWNDIPKVGWLDRPASHGRAGLHRIDVELLRGGPVDLDLFGLYSLTDDRYYAGNEGLPGDRETVRLGARLRGGERWRLGLDSEAFGGNVARDPDAGGAERRLVRRAELRLNLGGGGDPLVAALVPDRLDIRGELHETMPLDAGGGAGGVPADAALAGFGAGADAGRALKATLTWDEPDGGGSAFVAYNRHLPEDLTSYNRYRLVDEEELEVGRQIRGDGWRLRTALALQRGTGDGDLLHGARLKGALHLTPERGPGLESELKLIHRRDGDGGRRDWLQLKAVVDFTPLLPLPEQPDGGPPGVRPFVESYVKLEMGGNRSSGEAESWLDRGILLVAGGWRF